MEKFGNIESDEYMAGYDEMQKAFCDIKKQLVAMQDFYVLAALLSILDEMMEDLESKVQTLQKRLLFSRWIRIFIRDLSDWSEKVFVKQSCEDIYAYNDYFAKTILAMIEIMYKERI